MAQQSISTFRRTTTHVTVGYLVVTATLVVWFRHSVDHWPIVVATHLAVAVLLTGFQRLDTPPAPLAVLRDWHPSCSSPCSTRKSRHLPRRSETLSHVIPSLEAALFGGQPSVYLSELWSSVAVSEYLHFCYLSYVSVIPGVAAYWYVTGRRRAFHELVLLLSIVLLCSYLFFILFPVDSPYYLAAPLDPPLSGHFFYEVVHALSSRGGARGGAFPSAHVSGPSWSGWSRGVISETWRLSWPLSSGVSSWRPFTGASTTHSTPLLASQSPWRLSQYGVTSGLRSRARHQLGHTLLEFQVVNRLEHIERPLLHRLGLT